MATTIKDRVNETPKNGATETESAIDLEAQRHKRAQSIVAMGLIVRKENRFYIKSGNLSEREKVFEVWRNEKGQVCCTCAAFSEHAEAGIPFRCEHVLAIKYFLVPTTDPESEPETVSTEVEPHEPAPEEMSSALKNDAKSELASETVVEETETKIMNQEKTGTLTAGGVQKALRLMREPLDPKLVKTRVGWTDRSGKTQMVEYIEWHTVADILDRVAPTWSHAVRNIVEIGDLVAVTAAITIDGVTREGIGTGSAETEMGIKKAEHDALKRAAVKFGIARDLYQREGELVEGQDSAGFSIRNAQAKTLENLITPKQLGMIRALGRESGVDVEAEARALFGFNLEELSRRAASSFIDHLNNQSQEKSGVRAQENQAEEEGGGLRRAS